MVAASFYSRKVPSNHILLERSLVVEYFSTKIVAMVTVFSTMSNNEFYFCCVLAKSKYGMFFFWACLILAHLVAHKISDWLFIFKNTRDMAVQSACSTIIIIH